MNSLLNNRWQPHRPPGFSGFGPSLVATQARGRLAQHVIPKQRFDARTLLHEQCPMTPGVYAWLDSHDQICYVGKSKSLRKRLLSYFAKTPSDPKAARIRDHSRRLVWEPLSDELLALIREQELIYRWRPDFNTQGQPTRRQPAFVCLSSGAAPHAYFARQLTDKAAHAFGPIAGTGQLRAAIESLNQVFHLRDCPDKTKFSFTEQQQLFANPASAKCIRFELGTCPAPCAGRCSSAHYRQLVQHAEKFLDGSDRSALLQLQVQMASAAADQQFERATVLRDHWSNLKWLARRLDAIARARQSFHGVLPMTGRHGKTIWLVLRNGCLSGSIVYPDNVVRAGKAYALLKQHATSENRLPDSILEMNLQLILVSWFRQNSRQQPEFMTFEHAFEVCRQQIKRSA